MLSSLFLFVSCNRASDIDDNVIAPDSLKRRTILTLSSCREDLGFEAYMKKVTT